MVPNVNDVVFWAAVTFATPLIIAVIPLLRIRFTEGVLHLMLGLSAGILGGVTFVDILPEAFELAGEMSLPSIYVSAGVATGFLSLLVVERYMLSHDECHGSHFHIHETAIDPNHGPVGMSALAIHGLFDGFVIPVSFSAGAAVGAVITFAVAVHQIPDAFAALSLGLGTTKDRRKQVLYVLVAAADTPIGIALGMAATGLGGFVAPLGLGVSAGTFVYVSASDLVPELQHSSRSPHVVLSMIFGFVLVAAITLFLPHI